MTSLQNAAYRDGYDYTSESPHLKHASLRRRINESLVIEVERVRGETGKCEALEIGAGHGSFTRTLRNAGATVTVTEASRASAVSLEDTFASDPGVSVVLDLDGSWVFGTNRRFDMIVAISVLHHIPDYKSAVARYVALTRPGGTFVSWQDPMWYPRVPRAQRWAAEGAYFAWRVARGNYVRGLRTRLRRLRGFFDEREPSDMVEYHVVRQGVDEAAILDVLRPCFRETRLLTYWSTQADLLHQLGTVLGLTGTFALLAQARLPDD